MILKQVGGSWSDPQAGGVGHGVTLKQVGWDMERPSSRWGGWVME